MLTWWQAALVELGFLAGLVWALLEPELLPGVAPWVALQAIIWPPLYLVCATVVSSRRARRSREQD